MSVSEETPLQNAPEEKEAMETAVVQGPVTPGGLGGQHSAPSSPCVSRRPPHTLSIDSSKIPQPLASPLPLRRSGSLRLRGEKPGFGQGLSHPRMSSGRNGLGSCRTSPGTVFPSITESAECWKKSLRGAGDALSPTSSALTSSNLRQQRHHRSLQSLNSRSTSKDSYPHTPTPSPEDLDFLRPHNLNRFLLDHAKEFSGDHDDLDSLRSYGSNCSTQSACDHAQFARNGTTFSGKRMKYIVHCSSHPEPNEYLTPTQRANQQIRRLKALVEQARKDLEAKDENIFKLTKEVVELKLLRDEADSPPKTFRGTEESPVCRVVNQLENECGNSTSLSDSGHFDDVLSLTSAQSTHSPGPRQLTSTPESERLAEMYQRRIDDVTRKQGEKSVVDRKSLVERYEKKMEDMSRKSSEKFQQEKENLIEMYEKKIEDIVKRHQVHIQGEKRVIQEDNFNSSQTSLSDKSVQALTKKLEEMQYLLEMSERRAVNSTEQLDDLNARFGDLQQELFQCREKNVLLEEEVETLQKTVEVQQQQLTEKQVAMVQTAQLESELQVLQRHMEDQEKTAEQKSQLETELAKALNRLREEEQKCAALESQQIETAAMYQEKEQAASELKARLENELSRVLDCLKEEKKKNTEYQQENLLLTEKSKQMCQLESDFAMEMARLTACLKEEEQKQLELLKSKAEIEALCEENNKQAQQLRSHLESEIGRLQEAANEETQKCSVLESEHSEFLEVRNELKQTQQRVSQIESELACVNQCLCEEIQKNSDLLKWKVKAHNLKEQITNHAQEIQTLSQYSESLENEALELRKNLKEEKDRRKSLEEDRKSTKKAEVSNMRKLNDQLNQSKKEADEYLQEVRSLTQCLANAEERVLSLSSLPEKENGKNEELLKWKRETENLELEVKSLREDLLEKTGKLQYLSSIENEVKILKHNLSLENEKVQELLPWKSKAMDLEEALKSLKLEITEQIQKMHLVNELSESINRDVNSLKLPFKQSATEHEHSSPEKLVTQEIPHEAQQHILQLEMEVANLKESLDQSYWAQSEKETVRLATEKAVTDQSSQLQKLEADVIALNQSITRLKHENEELLMFKQEHLNNNVQSPMGSQEQEIVCQNVLLPNSIPVNGDDDNSSKLCKGLEMENVAEIVSELTAEIESLRKALADQEERHTEMNLKMYLKGQEAAKFERKDEVLEMAVQAPENVSIPELLTQLAETEKELEKVKDNQLENMPKSSLSLLSASEAVCLYLLGSFKAMYHQVAEGQANSSSNPEATLLFLKSAFYYFLTDEANCQGHLNAIQSILGFTELEKQTIDTLTYIRR